MSEEKVEYIVNGVECVNNTQLLFIAKRLMDIAEDIEKLSDEDKKFVIERVDEHKPYVLVDLYNALLEYME